MNQQRRNSWFDIGDASNVRSQAVVVACLVLLNSALALATGTFSSAVPIGTALGGGFFLLGVAVLARRRRRSEEPGAAD